MRPQRGSRKFELVWLVCERRYAIVYSDKWPPQSEYADPPFDRFWPALRMEKLPTTDQDVSVALPSGDPFDSDSPCYIDTIEAEGLLVGAVVWKDGQCVPDFGNYTLCQEQLVERS